MAKLNEQVMVIKVSELIKDDREPKEPDEDTTRQLEAVIGELAGPR